MADVEWEVVQWNTDLFGFTNNTPFRLGGDVKLALITNQVPIVKQFICHEYNGHTDDVAPGWSAPIPTPIQAAKFPTEKNIEVRQTIKFPITRYPRNSYSSLAEREKDHINGEEG